MTKTEFQTWLASNSYSIYRLSKETGIALTTLYRYRDGEYPIPKVVSLALEALEALEALTKKND